MILLGCTGVSETTFFYNQKALLVLSVKCIKNVRQKENNCWNISDIIIII